ncbi:MAG TPA: PQQ-dependent sugar dehydrogenase [Solirubrobacteraceae bacterium]
MPSRLLLALLFPLALTACGAGGDPAPVAPERTAAATSVTTVASGLEVPWGVALLPDGSALVSERPTGRIVRVPRNGGRAQTVMRVPGVVADGEGGLLGLAISPHYIADKLVYAYLTTASDNRIVRFRLGGRVRPILTGLQKASIHDGGRIAFGPDGMLYAGVGDAGNPANAQNRSSRNGKILRIAPNGSIPRGNPFPGSPVWSLGHRNVQGLAWDGAKRLWATEFGQNTWDEVNLIRKGRNYGWPVVEGKGGTQGGRFTNPLVTWRTDQASPSGVAVFGSNLFVGALRGERLWRIPIRGTSLGRPQSLLRGRFGRLRTVVAVRGSLWVTTSNRDGRGSPRSGDDRILRVRP